MRDRPQARDGRPLRHRAQRASADHPWLTEHPEWFQQRPDGTLKYAENPPKRYQDIYNFNWDTEAWRVLWNAWRDVLPALGATAGIKCYRVDNPAHEAVRVLGVDRSRRSTRSTATLVFLSEAFTRRAVMRELAKLGFTQSYTYFTWKNSRHEMVEYFSELAWGEEKEHFRPNFFPVTPDILHAYLQHGGPPAFVTRLVLAGHARARATASTPSYEQLRERAGPRGARRSTSNSEKYEIQERKLDGPLLPMMQRLNEIRRENVALQHLEQRCAGWTPGTTRSSPTPSRSREHDHRRRRTWTRTTPRRAWSRSRRVLGPRAGVRGRGSDSPASHYDWRIGQNYVRAGPASSASKFHLLKVL